MARYCECFRSGQICTPDCLCLNCRNVNLSQVPKAIERTGCHCVKSGCLKKYCECVQNGRKCGELCQCQNCHNMD